MSLVNDMLRDLDQRRRESDGGGAKVKLTPAREFRKEAASSKAPYILAGLVLVVMGLGFAWMQLSNDSSSQPIDVRPVDSVSFPIAVEDSVPAPQEDVPVSIERIPSQSGLAAVRAENPQPTDIISTAVQLNQGASTIVPAPSQVALTNTASGQRIAPAPAEVISAGEEVFVAATSPKSNVDLTSGFGIDSSVTNAAVVSEDEQDTLAVQEALRLIANNNLKGAYENLEKHMAENRYAHQSRETYAKLLVSEKSFLKAYALLEEGLTLAPNHPGFKKVKARVLIQNGQVLEAVELLLARAPFVGDDLEYHEILASAQLASRDYAGAAISYSGLVGENQTEGKFWYGYAAAQELLGNTDIAKQAYARAVQQSTLSANLRRRSQDRLLALGQ